MPGKVFESGSESWSLSCLSEPLEVLDARPCPDQLLEVSVGWAWILGKGSVSWRALTTRELRFRNREQRHLARFDADAIDIPLTLTSIWCGSVISASAISATRTSFGLARPI